MAIARFGRQGKRTYGFCVKITAVAVLGLCFIFAWVVFSSYSSSVSSRWSSFNEIAETTNTKESSSEYGRKKPPRHQTRKEHKEVKSESAAGVEDNRSANWSVSFPVKLPKKDTAKNHAREGSVNERLQDKEGEGEEVMIVDNGDALDSEEATEDVGGSSDSESLEKLEDEIVAKKKVRKKAGPLFDPKAHYYWRLCSTRSKHNYIPCIDMEGSVKLQRYRHTERTCPRTPPMCLVPLPHGGYLPHVHWPDSKLKILYKNVEHPKLGSFVKAHSWVMPSGEYLTFPQNHSAFKGSVSHYLESIEEMAPDIEWGKNIHVVLNIGCMDASFEAALLDKEVLTLSLGLKNDLVDLAQVSLERGFPALVSPFESRRLPFPSGVFDVIHCSGCSVRWHSNGGKLLMEMNRILRPRGYFILSTKHGNIDDEEALTELTSSICWNVLAHKTEDVSEMGVKIYQKPESNDIYELRRRKFPHLCDEHENPDAAWYVPMKSCLNPVPASIEERGTEWPEDWPERLETFPDWLNDKDKVIADTIHWKAVVNGSYLIGIGIDWSTIRNVMDMKASYGGFAASLLQQQVWVMNVVPVHAPDTLGIIYERGLFGVYHDWCEPFGTYPRSYDLLHADHLFARLKNRCKQPVAIVVEMDRILRPGGWVIIRDKVEILDPLEQILRSLHWVIRLTFSKDREGIVCAQKTSWRP